MSYNARKQLGKAKEHAIRNMKNNKVNIIMDENKIMERWRKISEIEKKK